MCFEHHQIEVKTYVYEDVYSRRTVRFGLFWYGKGGYLIHEIDIMPVIEPLYYEYIN